MPVGTAAPIASLFPVAVSVLNAFAENGLRKILVTSVLEDGRPVPPASMLSGGGQPRNGGWLDGFVKMASNTLASGKPDRVLTLQASPPRPDADRLRGV